MINFGHVAQYDEASIVILFSYDAPEKRAVTSVEFCTRSPVCTLQCNFEYIVSTAKRGDT